MNIKTPGTLALIGSSCLFLGNSFGQIKQVPGKSGIGVGIAYNLTYMAGLMGSFWNLLRLQAAGNSSFGLFILWIIWAHLWLLIAFPNALNSYPKEACGFVALLPFIRQKPKVY